LKLAESGANVAIHYFENDAAAKATLAKVRELGSDGFVIQADIRKLEDIRRMFQQVKREFTRLDIFVSNARTEPPTFYNRQWRSRWKAGTRPWTRKPRLFWWPSAKRRP